MRPPAMLTDKLAVLHCLLAALATAIPSAATNCEGSHSVRLLRWISLGSELGSELGFLKNTYFFNSDSCSQCVI